MGSIYKNKYKNKKGELVESQVWWIKYYRNGKSFRESTETTKKKKAIKHLALREGQIVKGEFSGLRAEKITFDELAQDLINDYKANNRKSIDRAKSSVNHLKGYFEGIRAIDITTDKIRDYITKRQDAGAKNGTINREMAALKRMFNLAYQMTPPKITRVPYIPYLKEPPPRAGFFEYNEYQAIKNALPSYLKPVITLAYHTGMRKKEILSLQWNQVDLIERTIILRAEDTKNSESRIVYMEGELLETIRFQKAVRDSNFPKCPWVFFGIKGKRIRDYRWAWGKACKEAGLEGKVPHDFRRTAVRNMSRAGVIEKVAMKVSGHKTRSVFDRYNIVNEDDLKRAARMVEEYHQEKIMDEKTLREVEVRESIIGETDKLAIH
ncbi:MAG: site-specific integrase [Thermodesulfobacteriota bacterium]